MKNSVQNFRIVINPGSNKRSLLTNMTQKNCFNEFQVAKKKNARMNRAFYILSKSHCSYVRRALI